MLDADTKHRIDAARNILVGKVPDPKSQVEQITIALIYKFMDDMDAESELLGGVRSFFVGKYEPYGWAKLMNSGLGGNEILNRYAEAMTELPRHQGLPQLFRDIFKNAYLPYRDPETLKLFLKQIDGFTYDHSERLGDAFEYLLSVLGTQGDAGQFRTPRHMIDFMVALLNPQKHESVLDPACGTAGFLIAAYKHIAAANRDAQGDSTLSQADRVKLAKNFVGYDISPDMVRLSRVNLYLHGFATPQIDEYDTLTQLDHWGKTVDVVLANPPFMSPKGGIQTHSKFSVQSKRSEVLFVDYMAEHLSPRGRAAIIVPEGIIFQSGSAYKQLRKMLVEQYLVAVISLPAGLFQPYSGVKTSILVLDRALAPTAKQVAFFTITNDGFALNAQRRAIAANDLPQVLADCTAWMQGLAAGNPINTVLPAAAPSVRPVAAPSVSPAAAPSVSPEPVEGLDVKGQGLRQAQSERIGAVLTPVHLVDKTKLAASGDYNLSGERYREGVAQNTEYPIVRLNEVCSINPETANPSTLSYPTFNYIDISCVENGSGKFLGATKIELKDAPCRARRSVKDSDILLATVRPNLKAFCLLKTAPANAIASTGFAVLRAKADVLTNAFLIHLLRHEKTISQMVGMMDKGAYPSINQSDIACLKIPLPPLAIQQAIVAEIERYQTIIDGARAVVDNYQPQIDIDPSWELTELGAIIESLESGVSVNSSNERATNRDKGILKTSCVSSGVFDPHQNKKILSTEQHLAKCNPIGNSIIISRMNTENLVGACAYVRETHANLYLPDRLWQTNIIRKDVATEYVQHILSSSQYRVKISALCGGTSGSMKNISKNSFLKLKIPLPPLATQQAIVAQIQTEQALVAANRELITRFEAKIAATLVRVWGDAAQ